MDVRTKRRFRFGLRGLLLAVAVCAVAPEPVTPCGGCRQKLREFAGADCPIWVADLDGHRATHTLGSLLPHSFGPEHLT